MDKVGLDWNKGKYFMGWMKSFWLGSPEMVRSSQMAIKEVEDGGFAAVMFKVPARDEIEFIHAIEKLIESKLK